MLINIYTLVSLIFLNQNVIFVKELICLFSFYSKNDFLIQVKNSEKKMPEK